MNKLETININNKRILASTYSDFGGEGGEGLYG